MVELTLRETASGEEAEFDDDIYVGGRRVLSHTKRDVAMVIIAPRGRAVIFTPSDLRFGAYMPQSEAVRTFMEQHRNGR